MTNSVSGDGAAAELVQALSQCQKILAMLIDPANKGSGISNIAAWCGCVAAEAKARSVLEARSALSSARGEK